MSILKVTILVKRLKRFSIIKLDWDFAQNILLKSIQAFRWSRGHTSTHTLTKITFALSKLEDIARSSNKARKGQWFTNWWLTDINSEAHLVVRIPSTCLSEFSFEERSLAGSEIFYNTYFNVSLYLLPISHKMNANLRTHFSGILLPVIFGMQRQTDVIEINKRNNYKSQEKSTVIRNQTIYILQVCPSTLWIKWIPKMVSREIHVQ